MATNGPKLHGLSVVGVVFMLTGLVFLIAGHTAVGISITTVGMGMTIAGLVAARKAAAANGRSETPPK